MENYYEISRAFMFEAHEHMDRAQRALNRDGSSHHWYVCKLHLQQALATISTFSKIHSKKFEKKEGSK